MPKELRGAYVLTGGGAGALDSISEAILENLDAALVQENGLIYRYSYVGAATDAEDIPLYIRPDDYTTSGVWTLQSIWVNNILLEGGSLDIKEQASTTGVSAGYGRVWVKNTVPNKVWFTDDNDVDFELAHLTNKISDLTACTSAELITKISDNTGTGLLVFGTSPVLTLPQINDASSDQQYIFAVSELSADRTITLPLLTGNDEFVFKDFIQILSNKTLITPTIASLTNAQHNHSNAAGGGNTLLSPIINTSISGTAFLDEDDMSSDSATKVASQQSIKKYVDDNTITQATKVTASGTAVDFTGLPTGLKQIQIIINGISTDGTEELLLQIGDSTAIETTGYVGVVSDGDTAFSSTTGWLLAHTGIENNNWNGIVHLLNLDSNNWLISATLARKGTDELNMAGGRKTITGGELARIRITSTGTPDDFDGGGINLQFR
jgi:hypothetical protein